MTDTNAIIPRLGAIFIESFHIEAPSAETDLFETGILDSLHLVELLLQLERRFGFRMTIENLDLDNLRTLERIARMVAAETLRELRPKGAEARAGRVRSMNDSPRDSVAAGPALPSARVR
jgi:D-alanine--poly(phosphoribitol) ligase subunit 2